MNKRSFFRLLPFGILLFAAFLLTCNRKDNDPELTQQTLVKPISVFFPAESLNALISISSPNEFAGLCFMPVDEGERMNLRAFRIEWNTSGGKPNEMVKVMEQNVMGQHSTVASPDLAAGDSEEFKLTMIDANTLQHFLQYDRFYGAPGQRATGLYLTRTMIMLPTGKQYHQYRSLLIKPFPEPVQERIETEASVAYYMGPVCPPKWYD